MMRLWKIDALGAAMLLALPAAAYWAAIAPAIRANTAAAAMANELTQQHATQESLERALNALKASTRSTAGTQPSLELVAATELNRRLSDLNDLAAAHGLQIDSLEPGDVSPHERFVTIPIKLSVQGSYRACQSWMAELHTAAPDVAMTQWGFTGVSADKNGLVRLTADLRWYALPAVSHK